LTFTPYHRWRYDHAVHHATAANLDKRGMGDVWTLTVEEYLAASPWQRFAYRVFRNPLVMFTVGPFVAFVISQRFVQGATGKRERYSVYWTNLALLGMAVALSLALGLRAYLLIQLPIMILAGSAGVWLFYVQHQFEDTYWERQAEWDFTSAALEGSSFYKLPRVLQWFSGNIGFHHVHHLSPRTPNYYLEKCHRENPLFQDVEPLTLRASLKSPTLHLWDEEHGRLVGFGYLKTLKAN
jgi:omega-6 fatty acid desaturase (delta-12 desaturase)